MRPFLLILSFTLVVACGAPVEGPDSAVETDHPKAEVSEGPAPTAAPALEDLDPEYVEEFQSWRDDRREGLLRPGSWLTLVGLHWLEEGATSFGSAEDNDFVLPAKAPAHAGSLILEGQTVRLRPTEEGRGSILAGETVVADDMELAPDISGEPTVVEIGSLRFFVIVRGPKVGIRLRDLESEALQEFAGLEYYPLDRKWRVEGKLIPSETPTTVDVPDVLGQILQQPTPGILELEIDGTVHRLKPIGEPGQGLFLVFGDETNGEDTYGAGRFLSTDAPDENGRVVVDFNFAYNPPCAFTPYATCPLPPAGNRLPVAVPAGEKSYALHP